MKHFWIFEVFAALTLTLCCVYEEVRRIVGYVLVVAIFCLWLSYIYSERHSIREKCIKRKYPLAYATYGFDKSYSKKKWKQLELEERNRASRFEYIKSNYPRSAAKLFRDENICHRSYYDLRYNQKLIVASYGDDDKWKSSEIKQTQRDYIKDLSQSIQKNHPIGYREFVFEYMPILTDRLVCANYKKILFFENLVDYFGSLVESQNAFSNYCNSLHTKIQENWGYEEHSIPIKENHYRPIKISHFFSKSTSLYPRYNYSYYDSHFKRVDSRVCEKVKMYEGIEIDEAFISTFKFFIKLIQNDISDCSFVGLFVNRGMEEDMFSDKRFGLIQHILGENGINCFNIQDFSFSKDTSKSLVIIIDSLTSSKDMKKNCELIIDRFNKTYISDDLCEVISGHNLKIVYLSLIKNHNVYEIQEIEEQCIESDSIKIKNDFPLGFHQWSLLAHDNASSKEVVNSKDEIIGLQRFMIRSLEKCTRCWEKIGQYKHEVKVFSLYYYYPTNVSIELLDEEDLQMRKRIWDFKNTSSLVSSHNAAMNAVIKDVKKLMLYFFNTTRCKLLTFVCINASTAESHEIRYKEFSATICKELSMTNAYDYISITEDGLPKHIFAEQNKLPCVEFDKEFFRGKCIVLFDDVITTGKSMARYTQLLEELGATVIGGISIGRTKHHKQSSCHPITGIKNHGQYDTPDIDMFIHLYNKYENIDEQWDSA